MIIVKGSDRLLEACRGLPGVSLAFAGSGKNAPSGSNVVFCKSLPHEDVSDFLNAIDVFVLPTRNEGWPIIFKNLFRRVSRKIKS